MRSFRKFCKLIVKVIFIALSFSNFFSTLLLASLSKWSQTVQKHQEAVFPRTPLCGPRVPMIDDDFIPFLFPEAVAWMSSLK